MAGRPPRPVRLAAPDAVDQQASEDSWMGWGTSLCWFSHALGSNSSCCASVAALLFGEPLGFNIARYNL